VAASTEIDEVFVTVKVAVGGVGTWGVTGGSQWDAVPQRATIPITRTAGGSFGTC